MARLRPSTSRSGKRLRITVSTGYVLSDTNRPSIWIEEEKCFLQLRRELGAGQLFYRHRPENTARKSGNIEDWVRRFRGRL